MGSVLKGFVVYDEVDLGACIEEYVGSCQNAFLRGQPTDLVNPAVVHRKVDTAADKGKYIGSLLKGNPTWTIN